MEYDTSTMYTGQNNFEKYQTAGEARRGINELIADMERNKARNYTLTGIGFFMSIPVINIWAPLGLSVLVSVAGYSIYDTFFKNRGKLKKYNNLREQFAEEEIRFRHQWMQESFSSASQQTSNSARDNYEARRQREREDEMREAQRRFNEHFEDHFKRNQQQYQRQQGSSYGSSSSSSSSKSYGANEQRGTFKSCVTVKDVKKVYRSKAKKHHPDVGGDAETFKALVIQYERALEIAQRVN